MPRPKSTTPAAGPGHNSIDKAKLKDIISRIEELENQKADISEDIKGIYAEAASNGYDKRALRAVVRLRRLDQIERQERQAVVDSYLEALGMLQGTPLGDYAMQRDGLIPPV